MIAKKYSYLLENIPPNPWRQLSSKSIYENPWIKVREDIVSKPGGGEGIYGVVTTRIATGVVAIDDQGFVHIVGQWRYPFSQYSWEIVEGGTEGNETALEAAKRELEEEAGLQAASWVQLGEDFQLSNCFSSEVGYVFLARNLSRIHSQPDPSEGLRAERILFKDLVELVDQGFIKDSVTIIGVQRAEKFLMPENV